MTAKDYESHMTIDSNDWCSLLFRVSANSVIVSYLNTEVAYIQYIRYTFHWIIAL